MYKEILRPTQLYKALELDVASALFIVEIEKKGIITG